MYSPAMWISSVERFLPYLRERRVRVVILIGMWQISGFQQNKRCGLNKFVELMLANPWVVHVFMQNPELRHPDLTTLPYGLLVDPVPAVNAWVDWAHPAKKQKTQVLFLSPMRFEDRAFRPDWWPHSAELANQSSYFENLARSQFVSSPGGDRYDCFRHWESILFDAIPVSNLPACVWRPLFGESMVYKTSKSDMAAGMAAMQKWDVSRSPYQQPNKELLFTSYWRERIADVAKGEKGLGAILQTATARCTTCGPGLHSPRAYNYKASKGFQL